MSLHRFDYFPLSLLTLHKAVSERRLVAMCRNGNIPLKRQPFNSNYNDNDTSHFKCTTESLERYGWKYEFSDDCQKPCRDGADMMWRGRSFQTRAAAIGKARSPTVDNQWSFRKKGTMETRKLVSKCQHKGALTFGGAGGECRRECGGYHSWKKNWDYMHKILQSGALLAGKWFAMPSIMRS